MIERTVPGFLPSVAGFRFANAFPPQPVFLVGLPGLAFALGDAANGLCGGMVFAACDLFAAGLAPPDTFRPPDRGDPLFHLLVQRLMDSFHLPWGPLKYYGWMLLPDRDTGALPGLVRRTATREWPRVHAEIDAGRPAPLGLVRLRSANPFRLGINHQVLAYGYRLDGDAGEATLRIYDPNYPLHDGLTLSFPLRPDRAGTPVAYSAGGLVRGFFYNRYRPYGPWRWRQAGLRPAPAGPALAARSARGGQETRA